MLFVNQPKPTTRHTHTVSYVTLFRSKPCVMIEEKEWKVKEIQRLLDSMKPGLSNDMKHVYYDQFQN